MTLNVSSDRKADDVLSGSIIVLNQGSFAEVTRTIRAAASARYQEIVVVGAAAGGDTGRYWPARTRYVACQSLSPAAALNRGVQAATGRTVLLLSDRVVPRACGINAHWRVVGNPQQWLLGVPERNLQAEGSPLIHFLRKSQVEVSINNVQDRDNVSGDLFLSDYCSFNRQSFLDLGGFNNLFGHSLYSADFGRRIYASGGTISVVQGATAEIQYSPDLKQCVASWKAYAKELVELWQVYPDVQVLRSAIDRLSEWVKFEVSEQSQRRLELVDAAMRKSKKPDLAAINRLSNMYSALVAKTISHEILKEPLKVRQLVLQVEGQCALPMMEN